MPYRKIYLIGISLLMAINALATDLPVRYLGIEQGLSNNAITCIYQDYRGFMWVGTYDGLNRFDGYNFKVYRNIIGDSTSLANNNIYYLEGDARHHLWVGLQNGLNVYDPLTARFSTPRYLPYNSKQPQTIQSELTAIRSLGNQGVLVGSRRKGLIMFADETHPGVQVPLLTANGIEDSYHVYAIEYDASAQKIYVSIKDQGLYRYDPARRSLELVSNGFTMAYCIKAGAAGKLWMGNDNGLFEYDVASKSFSSNRLPVKTTVVSLCRDREGTLWIGSDGAGVFHLRQGAAMAMPFQSVNGASLTNSNVVYALSEDNDGRKWIGTLRGGLNLVEPHALPFSHISYSTAGRTNLIDNFILSFCEDRRHNVFIGTDGAGLRYWDRQKNTFYNYRHDANDPRSISSDFITSLIKDANDDIWMSTWFGAICRLKSNSKTFEHYTLFNPKTKAEEHNAWLVFEDAQKQIWAGTTNDGTLYQYNRPQNKFEIFDPAIINLQSIAEDRAGNLWGGNYTSVIRIDRQHKRHQVYNIGQPVRCIHEDKSGAFWLGTQGAGLLLFDRNTGKYKQFTTVDGLPSNTILRMLEDDKGNLWLSTYNGLAKFNPTNKTCISYTLSDGLQSNQFSFNAGLALQSGHFLFGGIKGFNIFHPDSVYSKPQAPDLLLAGLRVNNKPLEADDAAIWERDNEIIKRITLPYDRAMLSLDFLVLNYGSSDKIKYAWFLEGWDKTWNDGKGSRTANYTRLQEGTYHFMVKASRPDGTWNKETQLLQIIVLPPWYRSWWAYVLYAISIVSMVYGYILYTRRQERLRYEIRLAHLENEKDKEITEKKLSWFTNISHEFRTPLSLIINPIKDKLKDSADVELTVAYRNARRLLSLVDQLLLFRKADSGEDLLKVAKSHIIELSRGVYQCFIQQAKAKHIQYHFIAPPALPGIYVDEEKIEIALFNLLSNAFKFTPDGGVITVELKENMNEVILIVKDTGSGISAEAQHTIFDKFGQDQNNAVQTVGFGIGLYLVKHFVESHRGVVSCESRLQEGTSFTITLQKGYSHLPATSIHQDAGTTHQLLEELAVEQEQTPVADTTASTAGKGKQVEEVVTEKKAILLVDDNRDIREYLHSLFEQRYLLYMADDGAEGLALAQEHLPDLIISDVNMKEMDGLELCRRIKQSDKLGHIPVILLTAATEAAVRLKGIEGGADDYLTKPFDKEILLARVEAILRSRNQLQRYFFDNITLRESSIKVPAEYQEFLRKCIEVVEENMDTDDFTIKKFSRAMGMSNSRLYQKVKAISGQSPNAFIRSIRLRRAAVLMLTEDMNVNQSATLVGIGDVRYFREQFVKLFGVTPSEYIKKYRPSFNNTFNTIKSKKD